MSSNVNFNNKSEVQTAPLLMDFECSHTKVDHLVKNRIGAKPVIANLVEIDQVSAPHVYKRFNDIEKKQQYRANLVSALEMAWSVKLGPQKAKEFASKFIELAMHLDENGALILAGILSKSDFQKLIDSYTKILEGSGSKSWIHAYLNLANHPDFLTNKEFNAAFMHPLLIALTSYRVGGPIRIVDARAKDAEPISILAQDNMLHIDNTPFNDEYKIILTWERGKPSGPKGQNFVFLPGTHKGARQCMIGSGGPWSSENASIFITKDSVEKVLTFQEKTLGKRAVVELTHDTKPLTTLFAAGSLVHHRHRTNEGFARSCMILAFHRTEDNPGQLIDQKHLSETALKTNSLPALLLTNQSKDAFINSLMENSDEMADLMVHINSELDSVEEIVPSARQLNNTDVQKWKEICTSAPTVEEKKEKESVVPLGKAFSREDFIAQVGKMMVYDKHGPLDLILYPDSHEEIRKWARNQIREKKIPLLNQQLQNTWGNVIRTPQEKDLLSPVELQSIAYQLAAIAKEHVEKKSQAILSENEKISPIDAYRSIEQLLLDLGESVVRCEDKTAFLSTSLFLFWAADTLMRFEGEHDPKIKKIGTQLLHNYIATAVLVEKSK